MSPRPSTCAGLTITTGRPCGADAQRLALGLGLRVGVGQPDARRVEDLRLVGGRRRPAPGRSPPTALVCTTRSTPARSASSSTTRVPTHVGAVQRPPPRAQRRGAGDVEEPVDPAQRPAHVARRSMTSPATTSTSSSASASSDAPLGHA